jgi:hypothetical protein
MCNQAGRVKVPTSFNPECPIHGKNPEPVEQAAPPRPLDSYRGRALPSEADLNVAGTIEPAPAAIEQAERERDEKKDVEWTRMKDHRNEWREYAYKGGVKPSDHVDVTPTDKPTKLQSSEAALRTLREASDALMRRYFGDEYQAKHFLEGTPGRKLI